MTVALDRTIDRPTGDESDYKALRSVQIAMADRRQLNLDVAAGFRELAQAGAWHHAVRLVVEEGGVSEARLADRLGVIRSTVNRWIRMKSRPMPAAIPGFAAQVMELLTER